MTAASSGRAHAHARARVRACARACACVRVRACARACACVRVRVVSCARVGLPCRPVAAASLSLRSASASPISTHRRVCWRKTASGHGCARVASTAIDYLEGLGVVLCVGEGGRQEEAHGVALKHEAYLQQAPSPLVQPTSSVWGASALSRARIECRAGMETYARLIRDELNELVLRPAWPLALSRRERERGPGSGIGP